jgi:hypothetical protein
MACTTGTSMSSSKAMIRAITKDMIKAIKAIKAIRAATIRVEEVATMMADTMVVVVVETFEVEAFRSVLLACFALLCLALLCSALPILSFAAGYDYESCE